MAAFAERLLTLRNQKKVSQTVVTKTVRITPHTYQHYGNDEREASVSTLIRMADYFKVTIDYLVGRNDTR